MVDQSSNRSPHSSLDTLAEGSNGSGNGRVQVWPGVRGEIPHRGFNRPDLKDVEAGRLPHGAQLYARKYDLSDDEQLVEYQRVLSRIMTHQMAGRMQMTHINRHWDDSKQSMVVYVEWLEYFTYLPDEALGKRR